MLCSNHLWLHQPLPLAHGLGFILDLDGVIFRFDALHEKAWRDYLRRTHTSNAGKGPIATRSVLRDPNNSAKGAPYTSNAGKGPITTRSVLRDPNNRHVNLAVKNFTSPELELWLAAHQLN
jgi:beta-phosphoglucomutase-like phosphatase (HAD superfamily)